MDAVVERDEVVQRVEDEDEFVRVFVMKKPLGFSKVKMNLFASLW